MVQESHQIPVETSTIAQEPRSTLEPTVFHPTFCFDCQKPYISKNPLEPCPWCKGANVINWAGSTLADKKTDFSSSSNGGP